MSSEPITRPEVCDECGNKDGFILRRIDYEGGATNQMGQGSSYQNTVMHFVFRWDCPKCPNVIRVRAPGKWMRPGSR